MSQNLWQMVQGMKGGTLQLADVQTNVSPQVFEKLNLMFGDSPRSTVSKIVKTAKGEWPS
ncbi:hypothetical protein F4V43_13390 [Paenibacillus spiritus]|uniref:Uncharacterized protein n=1 Tax=Paenibacillus spiritus TaxID=2496557 RepID=A0A5J5G5G3_9BACL|nr:MULTISPECIES: hypothetical protein [Paenibacillus]KAA9002407.1 hypothetical protein F4V43_13390 [Paenibacillus spiritus]